MNGFLVGDAGDVEKQELFVERPGDFIVAKHLPLEHRRSEAAADSEGDHADKEVEGCTTHEVTEPRFGTPGTGSRGLRCRLLDDSDDDGGYSSRDFTLQISRVPIIRRYSHQPCLHLVWAEDHPHSGTHAGAADVGSPYPTGIE
jgi:hypothetical protein